MKPIAALILATATLAAPAFAGGPTVTAPEPTVMPEAAPYVAPGLDWGGAYAGAQLGYGDTNSNVAAGDGYGTLGGIYGGYRWDMGDWVAGTEASWQKSGIDLGTTAGDGIDNLTTLQITAGREIGNSLVYGALGAAHANATLAGADHSDNGWLYGLGVDYAISDRWTVGGEVLQHKFNSFDSTGTDLDLTKVTAKLGLRF